MSAQKTLNKKRTLRAKRARTKIAGTGCPRLSVFKSNQYISAQIINDATQTTLAAATSKQKEGKKTAEDVGKEIAEKAKKAGVEKVVFDKGQYAYHGQLKKLAEAAREGGLQF